MMSKQEALHKAERHFSDLKQLVEQAIDEQWRVDQLERGLFTELLDMGLTLLTAFVAAQGDGDVGPQMEHAGQTLRRLDQPHKRPYVSIYGPLEIRGKKGPSIFWLDFKWRSGNLRPFGAIGLFGLAAWRSSSWRVRCGAK
jgi:hypothetical protein